jgi:hypothetical protein
MSFEISYRRASTAAKKIAEARRAALTGEWKTTPKLVKETKETWGRHGTWRGDVEWMPMTVLRKALYIDFRDPEQVDLDSKGGRPHINNLAKLMREGVPLPPAVGYFFKTSDGKLELTIHDGNHRLAAARKARVKKFPIIIYEPNRSAY